MERINLSVLSGVSHEGMLQLKSYVDMTGLDPQHQSYDYECLFPETCNPREVCLSFVKTADGYTFRVNPHFRYDGSNAIMVLLADQGTVSFSSWQEAEQALRTLTENVAGTTTSNATPDTLTDWNAISVPEPSESKTLSFEHLKERLQKMVVGQDDSTEAVAYIVAQHLAKKNPTKPVSILASGPPGVGKSETAKALAKILSQDCGQEYTVSWTDLNNFTEAFSAYRLIGAPAGYVGYEDEAVFEVVERNPYTIFIFDELDKAHPEVLKTFMAILDEGRCASRKALSDGSREFDFKHCIFFFTSNYDLSSNQPAKRKIGFAISDDVEDIHLKENEVSVSYRDEQASSISDESLPMRIYRENEAARKAFVGVGVLREIASRFQCFVNFKPLSAKAKTRILAKQVVEMGFEYSHSISYIAPSIMQGLIDAAMSGDSLTVRSFKSVIEGYLAPAFARAEVMDLESIKNMPVEYLAQDNAHLWLWIPNGLLQEGLDVMKAWGFTYRDPLVWNKTNVGLGLGNYLRNGCEIVLFGTRGRAPVKFKGQSNLLFAPRQDHSHNPEEFFAIVERLYDGPYLELFARRHPSSNKDWSVWGNEIESDIFIPGYPVPEYSDKAKEREEV